MQREAKKRYCSVQNCPNFQGTLDRNIRFYGFGTFKDAIVILTRHSNAHHFMVSIITVVQKMIGSFEANGNKQFMEKLQAEC